MAVPTADTERRRRELEAKFAALVADLPNRFPIEETVKAGDPRSGKERLKPGLHATDCHGATSALRHLERPVPGMARTCLRRGGAWTTLAPVAGQRPTCRISAIEPDGSILASGDQSKRDVYTLRLRGGLRGITAIRLEALPDDRLPNGGPGGSSMRACRRFLPERGPTDCRAASRWRSRRRRRAIPKHATAAAAAIDGDPQTGWSIGGGHGREQQGGFPARQAARSCERACDRALVRALLRRRAGPVPDLGDDRPAAGRRQRDTTRDRIDPARSRGQAEARTQFERLRRYFLTVAPELAKERAAIDQLKSQYAARARRRL